MILHSTLPYWRAMPNAALGYLKGFLEAKGIHVKNLYWNVVLSNRISDIQRIVGESLRDISPFSAEVVAFYISRHLLTENPENFTSTTFDLFFSSIYSNEELSEIINSIKDDIDHYIIQHDLHETTLAGFTMKTYQWLMSYYLICRLKEMNPGIKILIGGITNEFQGRVFMRVFKEADYTIWGEGEVSLLYLVRALEEGTTLNNVPQVVYRENGKIISTEDRSELCPPLDDYPFADHSDYFSISRKNELFKEDVFIPICGSRSCNWSRCRFCAINENHNYRARSPENIVEEIEFQSREYDIDTFYFMDTEVAGSRKRIIRLLKLLIDSAKKRGRPYRINAMISPLFIDFETAEYMKQAGFRQLQLGFEAVTDMLLEKMQKMHRLVHSIQALKAGDRYGLYLCGLNIMGGIPTETEDDIIESQENLKFFRFFFHRCHFCPTTYFLIKNSSFYSEMAVDEREKWIKDVLYEEIKPTNLISKFDRFEFFNFRLSVFKNYSLWHSFKNFLKFYSEKNYSYEWIEYPDGSLIEERGPRTRNHIFNRDETDIMIYCDSIKTFSELKQKFPHLSDDQLLEFLCKLKDLGLLYYWKDRRCISVLDASKRILYIHV
jgi:radical SAM superfamily enzyme YgiQ (UPF0313 family)